MNSQYPDRDSFTRRVFRLLDRHIEKSTEPEVLEWIDGLIKKQDEFGFDPFGLQPTFVRYVLPFARTVIERYFRVQTFGIENIPDGRVLVVSNHSGQIPIDGLVIVTTCVLERRPPRLLRTMIEKWVPNLPFLSYMFARCGQVVGTPENCRRLLGRDEGILVFPEGVRGVSKTFDKRYQLASFGLGFMRLALEYDTPIVPMAVIGAEEQAPALHNSRRIARVLGLPGFPITPTFPWLGPLGLIPLPVRYRLYFGEPLRFEGNPDDVDKVINKKVEVVRDAIKGLIQRGLDERSSVFW